VDPERIVITVKFFASLRDAVGTASVDVDAPDDLDGLLAALAGTLAKEGYEAITERSVRIAVNQTLVEGNSRLAPGDEVAFLPPVTGG
jgi:molybdopterin synthase sulfur carrier subunit